MYNVLIRISQQSEFGVFRRWARTAVILALVMAAGTAAVAQSGPGAVSPARTDTTEATTDHLRIRYKHTLARESDGSVRLTLEIAPRAGMHVYAPGADDYQVIKVTIAAQRGVEVRPLSYPPSETYHFEPLDEQIPVYQKPFTLTASMRVDQATSVKAGQPSNVRLSGRLDYQACDDKVCFAPASVPLSWTVLP